jgi:hypothetical protein
MPKTRAWLAASQAGASIDNQTLIRWLYRCRTSDVSDADEVDLP